MIRVNFGDRGMKTPELAGYAHGSSFLATLEVELDKERELKTHLNALDALATQICAHRPDT